MNKKSKLNGTEFKDLMIKIGLGGNDTLTSKFYSLKVKHFNIFFRVFEEFNKNYVDLKDLLIFLVSFNKIQIEEKVGSIVFSNQTNLLVFI